MEHSLSSFLCPLNILFARCIDVLELIENERLASFHAQTLKL